jgi:hypothetical protein
VRWVGWAPRVRVSAVCRGSRTTNGVTLGRELNDGQHSSGWTGHCRAFNNLDVTGLGLGRYKFKPIAIPMDSEGYCQSFSVDKKQAISDFFSVCVARGCRR